MKSKFLDYSMNIISKNCNYNSTALEEIKYGLEGIYLTFTKMIVLFGVSFILGIVKDFILILVFYNLIRLNSFGLHCNKSIHCLITSSILFIGGAYLCNKFNFPLTFMSITSIISILLLLIYAPADTYKRPLINSKKRFRFKVLSILSGIIYLILIIIYNKYSIVKYMWLGLVEATIMVLPITYKIYKLPYANYKNYN